MATPASIPPPLDFHTELKALVDAHSQWGSALGSAYSEAFAPGLGSWWLAALLVLVVGFVGERLSCWKLNGLNQRIVEAKATSVSASLGYGALRILFDFVGAVLFYVFAWTALYFSVDRGAPVYATLDIILFAIFKFRLILVVVRVILAPHAEGIRLLPMTNSDALTLHRSVMLFAGAYIALIANFEAVLLRVDLGSALCQHRLEPLRADRSVLLPGRHVHRYRDADGVPRARRPLPGHRPELRHVAVPVARRVLLRRNL